MLGWVASNPKVPHAIARLAVLTAAVASAWILSGATARAAPIPLGCALPCTFHPEEFSGVDFFPLDYSVPPDGRTYRWDIAYQSEDPLAHVTLDDPNQVEVYFERSLGDGVTESDYSWFDGVDFMWTPVTYQPNVASYLVRAPANFDFCAPTTPAGAICAASYNVWGNGTQVHLFANAPVTILRATETLIPEPATWALLLLGFFGAGAVLRSRNRSRVASA